MVHMKYRPEFSDIRSYEEFSTYYWYKDELIKICRELGINSTGTKQELNKVIQEYFWGSFIKRKPHRYKPKVSVSEVTLHTPLLECGFSFNLKFRKYFSILTGVSPFKFTADMATAWRKVKREKDRSFIIQDMLAVYYGQSHYAKYDNSVCQWNRFVKEFCADEKSKCYINKLKVASILWKEVRDSTTIKKYTTELLKQYAYKINVYKK